MKTLSGPTQRGLDPSRRSEVSIQHVCFKVCSQSGRKSVGVRAGRLAPPSRFRSASLWRGVCVSREWRRRLNTKAVCCLCLAVCRLLVSLLGGEARPRHAPQVQLLRSRGPSEEASFSLLLFCTSAWRSPGPAAR